MLQRNPYEIVLCVAHLEPDGHGGAVFDDDEAARWIAAGLDLIDDANPVLAYRRTNRDIRPAQLIHQVELGDWAAAERPQ